MTLEVKSLVNPFADAISFDLIAPTDQLTNFVLYDAFGRLISTQNQFIHQGINAVRLNGFGALQSGCYMLQIRYANTLLIKRMIKAGS